MLHGVRLRGMAGGDALALRTGVPVADVEELLLDFEAYGWVSRSQLAGIEGWSLTDAGRAHGEMLLAEELRAVHGQAVAQRAHHGFLALNAQFLEAITAWQLGSHSDTLLDDLAAITRSVHPLLDLLAPSVPWFEGYGERLRLALGMALVGRAEWVDGLEVDSLHRVWFELHEDLLATLGARR